MKVWNTMDYLERKWMQELGILVFSFMLFTLNDWILIASLKSFFLGIIYFLLLYTHAQLNRYLLLPILFKKKYNWFWYVFLTLVALVVFTFLLYHLTKDVLYTSCYFFKDSSKLTFQYQFGVLLGSCICILGTTQFLEYYRGQKYAANKEILSNKNQIDLLNKQLNPHFLFNTLNTIYGLSIKFPEKTPGVIMKVSELLRYQLENSNRDLVSLQDEVSFIQSYIELERERVGYRCKIEFEFYDDALKQYYLAPMIVFTFVENAFKHGTSNIDACFIHINLRVNNGELSLKIKNSVPVKKEPFPSTKVGLENAKTRLKMIYPEKYNLNIIASERVFYTDLKISL
ncbi:sensor histidine kinase [Flavobacterium sp. JP2137]|uniref:sensor histidine kinase n=1 Tax=Flavobacterium sp. JP2137 TaxID=3414510 RepID=UPI003D2FBE08